MAKTYTQYVEQIESLKKEAEEVKRKEVQGVIERIRQAIAAYGFTAADLGLVARAGKGAGRKGAAPKVASAKKAIVVRFKDDAGHTWSGRGPKPKWLKDGLASGKSMDSFTV